MYMVEPRGFMNRLQQLLEELQAGVPEAVPMGALFILILGAGFLGARIMIGMWHRPPGSPTPAND